MVTDGTISYDDFCVAAHAFSEKWMKFNSDSPNWSWIATQKVDGYLSLENFVIRSDQIDQERASPIEEEEEEEEEEFDVVDDATLVSGDYGCEMHHRYEFHIVYSSSFRVPVLYFRAYDGDGQLSTMNDIEFDLSSDSLKLLTESKWTFITLEDHPHLNRPWFMLHPCATSEWMKLLLENNQNAPKLEHYLVSWLSVVGQVFRLKVPLEMQKVVQNLDNIY